MRYSFMLICSIEVNCGPHFLILESSEQSILCLSVADL